jgi:hypothetical protein
VVSVTLRPDGRGGTVLEFLQVPIFDPRSAEGWRFVLERLGETLQQIG